MADTPNFVPKRILESNLPISGTDGEIYFTDKQNIYVVKSDNSLLKITDLLEVNVLPTSGQLTGKAYLLNTNKTVNYWNGTSWDNFGSIKPANYIYVSKNGNDTSGDGSANAPYLTIQNAINIATSGTTVFIFPGTYTENLTLKAGVNIISPAKFSVYISGNHTANFSGTIVFDNITLNSASGITLSFTGTNAQNLQFFNSCINSTDGDAINCTNTNASSKIYLEDGTVNVSTSGSTARCVYTASTAKGSFIANRVSFKLDNADNVCIALNGTVSFTHTSDQIVGQVTCSNTTSATIAQVAISTATVPVFVTNSSSMSIFTSVIVTTTSSPAISGAGMFSFMAVLYGSTGVGGSSTLNGGIGAISLPIGSIKLRDSSLVPSANVTSGSNDGAFEYDGTNLYITLNKVRYKVSVTAP